MALLNDTKKDIKVMSIQSGITLKEVAQKIGTSKQQMSNALNYRVINTSFIRTMQAFGYDVKLVYVPREQDKE